MTVLAGIDEAGFGPILGPLVVSAVVFDAPPELAGGDLWHALAPAIARAGRKGFAGLVINDSKKVYTPKNGLVHLERGVLGTLESLGTPAGTLHELLGRLCPGVLEQLDEYPWYAQGDLALPAEVDAMDLRLRAKGLSAALEGVGGRLAGLQSRVVLEGHYNRLVRATHNKGTTLLDQTCGLIDWVWRGCRRRDDVRIYVDRQGGRLHYLPTLQRMFPGGAFKILDERPEHSAYRIAVDGGCLEIHFLQGGDAHQLPIALASMTSKYLRELLMAVFNRYWAGHVPGLRPTAGYYTDGQRFLQDIADTCRRLETPMDLLVRER